MRKIVPLLLMVCTLLNLTSCVSAPAPQLTQDDRMAWWRDARFGLFIHWGLYSTCGGDWKGTDYGKEMGGFSAEWLMYQAKIPGEEYRKLTKQFNPVKFDAAEWVSMAKAAGMKYIVITAKHHEGFCLFDTDYTDYNVVDATPFKRDIIKEMSEECKKQGIHFGVYYSQWQDWYHRYNRGLDEPGTMTEEDYLKMVQHHIRELLTQYGDIDVFWFDTGGKDVEEANRQGALVRELQPKTIICDRLYSRRNVPRELQIYADFRSLPDRQVAKSRVEDDAETCMTMRDNWGYDRDDNHWKSTKDIIERLVLSASRGVNFLLNVGPTPEGTFCPEEMDRLKAIGAWMKVHGESIYGTAYSPLDFDFTWGAMTQKSGKLYLHVMKWNPEGIVFNGIVNKPRKAYLLDDPGQKALPVRYEADGHITTVEVSAEAADPNDTVIVLEYGTPLQIDPNATGEYHWIKSKGLTREK